MTLIKSVLLGFLQLVSIKLMEKNSFYLPDSHPLCQFIDFDVHVLNINIHTDLKV